MMNIDKEHSLFFVLQ